MRYLTRNSVEPPFWWRPWLRPYYAFIEWWERPREVKLP